MSFSIKVTLRVKSVQRYKKKHTPAKRVCIFYTIKKRLFEISHCFFVLNYLLLEDVSAGLRAFYHFDALRMVTSCITCMKGSDRFLCHSVILFLMLIT